MEWFKGMDDCTRKMIFLMSLFFLFIVFVGYLSSFYLSDYSKFCGYYGMNASGELCINSTHVCSVNFRACENCSVGWWLRCYEYDGKIEDVEK